MLQVSDSSLSPAVTSLSCLPQMIHVGFAKAASTYVQSYLRHHPDAYLVFKSNYFTPFPARPTSPEQYATHFKDAPKNKISIESDEHIIMPVFHPTLGVRALTRSSTDQVIAMLGTTVPDARILLIIRNHIDMLVSTYSQYLLGGGTLDIDRFVMRFLEVQDDGQEYFAAYFAEIIQKFQKQFSGRVLALLLCDFKHDSQNCLDRICDFSGLKHRKFHGNFIVRRTGLSSKGCRILRTFNRCVARETDGRYWPKQIVPQRCYVWLCDFIRVLDHVANPMLTSRRLELSETVKNEVTRRFANDNRDLERLLGRQLSSLGYSTSFKE